METPPEPPPAKLAHALASPTGVLVILPLLVLGAGVTVMLLGRGATREASESMARTALVAQAGDIQHDFAFALDQADPLLVALRPLADPALPRDEVALRLHDDVIGRPGITNVSIAFPSGLMRGTFIDESTHQVQVQESLVTDHGTERTNLSFDADGVHVFSTEPDTTYDPRTRPHYIRAVERKARVWLPPRTFFTSHKTGLTVTEPVYAADQILRAVITVDFDVSELSQFIDHPPCKECRTLVFTSDGTILASGRAFGRTFGAGSLPNVASEQNRLLRHEDFADPALEALFAAIGQTPASEQTFLQVHASDGNYLASVAPVGGKRAGIEAPIDWYLATLVPEAVLLGATKKLEKASLFASAGALALALGVALIFAWNIVRMRRAVGAARAAARTAEARAKELGSYRLVDKLAFGGMGEVWRAEHRLLARHAAVKLVRADALRDPALAPKLRERFRREAQTVASMRSRNTIELYDYGVAEDGTFYYVMELLDGVDLDKLVRAHGPLPAARVIHLLVQACQSLAEAHDAGLLHRDIKPANLCACRAADEVDLLKVLDFGIVQTIADAVADPAGGVAPTTDRAVTTGERLTQAGVVVGTPGYIAPEVAFGQHVIDGRADLYALGCVAWWLLTSREVFPSENDYASLLAHASDDVPRLAALVTGWLPEPLEQVITSMLAKDPYDRPANARALARMLRAIEIPDEHAWTDDRARAWWSEHRPPGDHEDATHEPTSESVERMLVPEGAGVPTFVPASSPEAATIELRK